MQLHVRILYTDGQVSHKTVSMPRYRKATNAMVAFGTRERKMNPDVVAIRSQETGTGYTWVGHCSPAEVLLADSNW